jgi:hypothetical protein
MAGNPYLLQTVLLAGTVTNPVSATATDGSTTGLALGRQSDALTSAVHGPWGLMASRRSTFFAQVTSAAGTIAINTTTSAATFTLVNPIGSGVNLELIDFTLHLLSTGAAPATANIVGLSFVDINVNAITGITRIPVPTGGGANAAGAVNGNIGGAAGQGYVATVITYASALTVAANWGYGLFSFPASWVPTVGGYPVPLTHEFKGKIILPPGHAASLVASTAWGANTTAPSISWAEYPA